MRSWFKMLWPRLRDSLWFLPAVLTVLAAALAITLVVVERQGLLWSGPAPGWLYQGGADGARSVLSAVTGSLITVTGVVFSVTIVAVQLASSQYTPRVLRDFTSDRGNQLVFGIFIGTFTYAILVLRTVQSSGEGREEFVPRLAVTVAVVLLIACVAALIYFVNHLAREIHITALTDRIALETLPNVRRLFPEHVGSAADAPRPDPRKPEHPSFTVCAAESGYIKIVHQASLFGIDREIVIGMEPKIGTHILPGQPLASIWVEGEVDGELEKRIRSAFVLGEERSPEQDVEYGMMQISDVAIKALSPSINDPTTAIRCIDRLAAILAELGSRNPPETHRTRDGRVHFIASYTTYDDAIKVAFDEVRHFGASIPVIAEHLLRTLADLAELVHARNRPPLYDQARAVLHSAREEIQNPRDREAVERAAERLPEAIGRDVDSESKPAA